MAQKNKHHIWYPLSWKFQISQRNHQRYHKCHFCRHFGKHRIPSELPFFAGVALFRIAGFNVHFRLPIEKSISGVSVASNISCYSPLTVKRKQKYLKGTILISQHTNTIVLCCWESDMNVKVSVELAAWMFTGMHVREPTLLFFCSNSYILKCIVSKKPGLFEKS